MTIGAATEHKVVKRTSRVWVAIVVLALCTSVLLAQAFISSRSMGKFFPRDIGIASTLFETGTFADVYVPAGKDANPGRWAAPGYPFFLAALAAIAPDMADGMRCVASLREKCDAPFPFDVVVITQAALAALTIIMVFFIARDLSRSQEIGLLTAVMTLAAGRFAEFSKLLLPYNAITALLIGSCLLLLKAWRNDSPLLFFLAGLALGMTALFDPVYLSILWLVAVVAGVSLVRGKGKPIRTGAVAALLVVIGGYIAIGPWQARNYALFGETAIAPGIMAQKLAERVSYNSMTAYDYVVAAVTWLPGIGDGYGTFFFGREAVDHLGAYVPGSFPSQGLEIYQANPTVEVISDRYIIADPVHYALSAIPLWHRGLWATGSIFVIWGAFLIPRLIRRLRATNNLAPFLVVAVPLLLTSIIQGLLTGNQPWTNMGLLFVYTYAIAHVFAGLELPLSWRQPRAVSMPNAA